MVTLGDRFRNDLYCVEWDVKLYYTIQLPWGRVAMPLINPLMPVPQWRQT